MTPAELKITCDSLNISGVALAERAGVQVRTAQRWMGGTARVPDAVVDDLTALDALVDKVAGRVVRTTLSVDYAGRPSEVALLVYREDEDLAGSHPDVAEALGHPAAAIHRAMILRVRRALLSSGIPVRVVWMRPAEYQAWRTAEGLPDGQSARATWAAAQG